MEYWSYPPSYDEIDAALNQTPGYGGEHQIVITRDAAMDELLLRIESSLDDSRAVETFRLDASQRIHTLLGLRTKAEIVPRGSLPRTDFKARRVIDDRAAFREMYAHIEAESDG